jgi:carbon monoxide dehydrogenase subunit G
MATRIDETITVHAPIDRAWEILTNLGMLAACVPGAELISSPEPRTVLARLGSYNASARVADRDDKARSLRMIAAARAATGPSAAASLTVSLTPRSDGAITLELDGDIDLIDTAIKSIPTATIRAFVVSLRTRLEQPIAPAAGKTPPTANLAVPSLATTGVMPAYKPPPRPSAATPVRSSTPIANPTVAPPAPAAANPVPDAEPASTLDAVRDWLTSRRDKRDS